MAIFQDNMVKLVPECLYYGFYWIIRMNDVMVI